MGESVAGSFDRATEGEAAGCSVIVVRSVSLRSARDVTARGEVAETQNAIA